MEKELKELCKISELPIGTMKGFTVEGKQILVANVNGEFFAINAVCNHTSGYLPSGEIQGKLVTCPVHHCKFNVTDGDVVKNVNWMIRMSLGPCYRQQTFRVKTKNGNVMIEI